MSNKRIVVIDCDGCKEQIEIPESDFDMNILQSLYGWFSQVSNVDICPGCFDEIYTHYQMILDDKLLENKEKE